MFQTIQDPAAVVMLTRVLEGYCVKSRILGSEQREQIARTLLGYYEDGWTEKQALVDLLNFDTQSALADR